MAPSEHVRLQCKLAQELLSQEMKISIWAQSNADICKKAVNHKFIISGGYSADFYGRTAKTADMRTAIRQSPCTLYIFMLEEKIQKTFDYLFWFSIGGFVMDQRSRDGTIHLEELKLFAIHCW